jgi:Winged helix-turn-helix DNA-binding
MTAERDQLDQDISALRDILSRRVASIAAAKPDKVLPEKVRRSAGREAIVKVLADGGIWSPSQVAERVGKTPAAASAALRRLVKDGVLEDAGFGKYRLKPTLPTSDWRESLLSSGAEAGANNHWAKKEVQTPASAQ